jgi:hypothetical protein
MLRQGLLRLLDQTRAGSGPSTQGDQSGGIGQDFADGGQEA